MITNHAAADYHLLRVPFGLCLVREVLRPLFTTERTVTLLGGADPHRSIRPDMIPDH